MKKVNNVMCGFHSDIMHIFYYSFGLVDYFLGRVRCTLDSWHNHRHYCLQMQESAGKKEKRDSASNSKGTITADTIVAIILYKHKPDTDLQLYSIREFHLNQSSFSSLSRQRKMSQGCELKVKNRQAALSAFKNVYKFQD